MIQAWYEIMGTIMVTRMVETTIIMRMEMTRVMSIGTAG
jgi:hypothetical protein